MDSIGENKKTRLDNEDTIKELTVQLTDIEALLSWYLIGNADNRT